MSLSRRACVHVVLVLTALLALTGCGKTVIDDAKTEAALEQNLSSSLNKKVDSVDCPSGIEVVPEETFTCTVLLRGGGEETATLKILNEDADVEVTGLSSEGQKQG